MNTRTLLALAALTASTFSATAGAADIFLHGLVNDKALAAKLSTDVRTSAGAVSDNATYWLAGTQFTPAAGSQFFNYGGNVSLFDRSSRAAYDLQAALRSNGQYNTLRAHSMGALLTNYTQYLYGWGGVGRVITVNAADGGSEMATFGAATMTTADAQFGLTVTQARSFPHDSWGAVYYRYAGYNAHNDLGTSAAFSLGMLAAFANSSTWLGVGDHDGVVAWHSQFGSDAPRKVCAQNITTNTNWGFGAGFLGCKTYDNSKRNPVFYNTIPVDYKWVNHAVGVGMQSLTGGGVSTSQDIAPAASTAGGGYNTFGAGSTDPGSPSNVQDLGGLE